MVCLTEVRFQRNGPIVVGFGAAHVSQKVAGVRSVHEYAGEIGKRLRVLKEFDRLRNSVLRLTNIFQQLFRNLPEEYPLQRSFSWRTLEEHTSEKLQAGTNASSGLSWGRRRSIASSRFPQADQDSAATCMKYGSDRCSP